MRLLIITQKVDQNDDVLGFFVGWIKEFSKKFEKVTVICLKEGKYDLPSNVKVLSLGKEKGLPKWRWLLNFYKYIWRERRNYDAVFAHMNPKYIPLGWPVWRMLGKKVSLWYAHGHVPSMLKVADRLADLAFASTKEGYRLSSGKLKIVGQGIDVNKFFPLIPKPRNEVFQIITVGRISPSKDYETLIKAAALLAEENLKFELKIVGGVAYPEQEEYLKKLNDLVKEKDLSGRVEFAGPVANKDLPPVLRTADLFVNMGHTGSLDKANLEAMACGLPLLTCNEAFADVLGRYADFLMYPKRDFEKLAEKIKHIMDISESERKKISDDLREIIVRDHNLEGLINKISQALYG